MLHVNSTFFNHPNLIQLTWKAIISEYDNIPAGSNPYELRIEFNGVGFMGTGTYSYGYTSVGAMIQNTGHSFSDDAFGTITTFPALGLYLSSLESSWPNNSHGVSLNVDPAILPLFGRCFENIDGLGTVGENIYTREDVGTPSSSNPVEIRWTVTKGETVVDPAGQFSRNLDGAWVALSGTFVKWDFRIEINGELYDVADYYLPIENAEYISAWDPLYLHQEYFGSAEDILDSQKGTVRYTDIRASDGTNWYPLENWQLTWRIDDGAGNLDNRFGWKSDGLSLTSRVGHEEDIAECSRDVGTEFSVSFSQQDSFQKIQGTNAFSYASSEEPLLSTDPAFAQPIGLGSAAGDGDRLTLQVGLDPFSAPVDLYLGIYAPSFDPSNIYLMNQGRTLQKLADGIVPWKSDISDSITETIFDMQTSPFPTGTYDFLLMATPAGSYDAYYLWETFLEITAH